MNRVKRKALKTLFLSAVLSVLSFQTLRVLIQWTNLICLFFTWCNSSFFVVAVYFFSYEVCDKSPLDPNPALLNSIGIIISALAKMGLKPLSSANNSLVPKCPLWQPSFYYFEHVFLFIFRVKMVRKMPFLLQLQLKCLIILQEVAEEATHLLTVFMITHMKV